MEGIDSSFIRQCCFGWFESDAYRQLVGKVLAREGWRCQDCGTAQDLQVHHLRSRSQLGNDAEENLIALCAGCYRARDIDRQTQ